MKLPPQAIVEFQTLWKEQSGEDLPFEEAQRQATVFLQVLRGALIHRSSRDPP